jgi:linoleoyl-CoA desaturase
MAVRAVTFQNQRDPGFAKEVKARVSAYFKENGISPHADGRMVRKTMIILGTFVGCYALLYAGLPLWMMWLLCVVIGIAMAGIGFSIGHDALHGAYSANPRVNQFLGYTFDIVGANGYIWKITHNIIHHTYTNIHGHDEDLEVAGFIRLSPGMPHQWVHRFQHVLAFFAYSFATLFWLFVKDYKYFFSSELGPYENKQHPAGEWAFLIGTKILIYGYQILLPLLFLDITWWQFLIGFLTAHMTAGLILGVIFQLAHVVEETDHPTQNEQGFIENAWFIHQMETTNNFARSNRFLNWYIGGLNYQIEHHLFPRVCSIHYDAISPIVEETAKKYGIVYNNHETLLQAIRSHYRTLKKFGDPAFSLA